MPSAQFCSLSESNLFGHSGQLVAPSATRGALSELHLTHFIEFMSDVYVLKGHGLQEERELTYVPGSQVEAVVKVR